MWLGTGAVVDDSVSAVSPVNTESTVVWSNGATKFRVLRNDFSICVTAVSNPGLVDAGLHQDTFRALWSGPISLFSWIEQVSVTLVVPVSAVIVIGSTDTCEILVSAILRSYK